MRLFAAIDLPPAVTDSLTHAVPEGERLRLVPPAQWHVTLAFYGEVDEPLVPDLQTLLGRAAARTTPLHLALSGGGSFPPAPRPARVLWCGVAGDVALLTRLADRAEAAGRRCGITLESRPFRPHLTLARARGAPLDLQRAVDALAAYASPEWTADTLHLVQSHLGPTTRHEHLASWPLGTAGRPDPPPAT